VILRWTSSPRSESRLSDVLLWLCSCELVVVGVRIAIVGVRKQITRHLFSLTRRTHLVSLAGLAGSRGVEGGSYMYIGIGGLIILLVLLYVLLG
jgi:hypothetical protein